MKVGIIGSGDVAKALGDGFLAHGHETMLGTRDAAKLADWQRKNPKGRVGSMSDAAAFGEVVLLAVKGLVASEALRALRHRSPCRQSRDRRYQSHCRCATRSRRAQVLHRPQRVADGIAAAAVSLRSFCEGI